MAIDVADFLFNKEQKVMFVEAPVGTGKSLGLLVPTALYLKKNNKKSVYATATINLQNQIFSKDSVALQKLGLIKPNEKLLAQGQSHYTCRTVFKNNSSRFSEEEYEQLLDFFNNCDYGLFSELYEIYPDFDKSKEKYLILNQISNFDCFEPCRGHSHRRRYKSHNNKLLITNHDQLIQSYLNTQENGFPIINYEDRVIIVDEAHSLKETFLGRLESKNKFDFSKIPKPMSRLIDQKLRKEYTEAWGNINNLNEKFSGKNGADNKSRVSLNKENISNLKKICRILNQSSVAQILEEEINRISRKKRPDKLSDIIKTLTNYLKYDDKKWIEREKGLSFHRVTLNFEQEFNKMIDALSRNSKIIFMSGTLTTGDPKQDIAENWKLNEYKYIYKKYSSIFNLKEQAIVYIPQRICHPKNNEYNNRHLYEMNKMLPDLINTTPGGSLVLCTSKEYLAEVTTSLRKSKRIKYNVLSQTDGDTQSLGRDFAEDKNSILVGSGSFFTGFSIEGKALNKLFLNKLPYPVPSDAYIELISQGYSDKERYEKIIAPMMLKKLEQAMGRLIRTKTDTGVITIFDKRIAPGKYPYKFIEFLGYTITSDLSEVEKFIKKIISNKISSINKAFDEQLLIIPEVPRLAKKLTKPTQSRTKNPSQSNNSGFISPRNQKAKLSNPIPSPNRNGKYKNTQPVYKPKSRTRSDLYMERNWLIKFMNEHKNDTDKQADKIVASKLNTSAAIFQNGLNFCHQKAIDYHLVFDTYPYIDDNQKHNFELKRPQSPGDFKVDWL